MKKMTELKKSESREIACLEGNEYALQKLTSLGVLPKKVIKIIQRRPVYVLEINNSQIVIDKELAACVYVED